MKLVIDASFAIKWYVIHEDTPTAMQIAGSAADLLAPGLILAEVANAFWKYVRANQMQPGHASRALLVLPGRLDPLVAMSSLADAALQIGIMLSHRVCDCFYLALARREGASLVTVDKRLAVAARNLPHIEVRLLGGG